MIGKPYSHSKITAATTTWWFFG